METKYLLLTTLSLLSSLVLSQSLKTNIGSINSDKLFCSQSYPETKIILNKDKNTNYFAFGIGFSSYKPVSRSVYEGNFYFHFSRDIYIMTGFSYFDDLKSSSPDMTFFYDLNANLYILRTWQFSKLYALFAGFGLSSSFYSAGLNLSLKFDIAVNNSAYLGLQIKQQFISSQYPPDYLKYPIISIQYSIKL